MTKKTGLSMSNSMSKSMSKKKKAQDEKKKRKSIRLYPPVEAKMENVTNFNYWVNQILGEKLGVDPEVIDAYARGDKNEN